MASISPSPQPVPDAERIISDLEALKVYFDPMRARIIRTIANEPRTVQQIAEELDVPFTRLYYHMNMLERHGFIRVVETRNLSGAVEEKFYQVAARMFVVDRALLTTRPGDEINEGLEMVMSEVLDATRSEIRHNAREGKINLAALAPEPGSLLLRRGVFSLPKERAREFYQRMIALMNEFSAVDCDEDCEFYAIAVAFYPTALQPGDEPPHA